MLAPGTEKLGWRGGALVGWIFHELILVRFQHDPWWFQQLLDFQGSDDGFDLARNQDASGGICVCLDSGTKRVESGTRRNLRVGREEVNGSPPA